MLVLLHLAAHICRLRRYQCSLFDSPPSRRRISAVSLSGSQNGRKAMALWLSLRPFSFRVLKEQGLLLLRLYLLLFSFSCLLGSVSANVAARGSRWSKRRHKCGSDDDPLNVTKTDEYQLFKALFTDYDPTVRPRYDSTQAVRVNVRFSLQQIYDLDEKRQVLTISGWLTAEWEDEFLVWNPADYGNITKVVTDPSHIWTPKLAIGNSADKMFHDWKHFWITVRHTGTARWQPGGNFAFSCALDMNYYPFDEQECTMELETWYYTSDKVNMTISMSHFGLETYLPHGEWALVMTQVWRQDVIYRYYTYEAFPEVFFSIHLRRKYTFYFMYILLPCIMLSCVQLMIFLLPAESGEKISLGVSILVSFSLFLLIVADQVPDTSDAVPVIAIYLMYFMMTTALAVMASTLILRLHFRGFDKQTPMWLRFLVFDLLAPCLCLRSVSSWKRHHGGCLHYRDVAIEAPAEPTNKNGDCLRQRLTVAKEEDHDASPGACSDVTNGAVGGSGSCTIPDSEHIATEWKKVSEVLDRLFFWIFMVFVMIPLVSLAGFVNMFKPPSKTDTADLSSNDVAS